MISRSQIKQWARSGQLTPERIAQIVAAHRTGQVERDVSGVDVARPQPLMVEPQLPRVGGTEIVAPRIEARVSKVWWLPR